MVVKCHKCEQSLYQDQCVNLKCSRFSADAALDWVEEELLPDMCLDFEGFEARQNESNKPGIPQVSRICRDGN